MNVRETMIFIRKPIGEIASFLQSFATPSEFVEGNEIALLYEGLGPGGTTFGLSTDTDAPEGDRWTHLLSSDDSPDILAALLRQLDVGSEQLQAATDWQGRPLIDLGPIEAQLDRTVGSDLMTKTVGVDEKPIGATHRRSRFPSKFEIYKSKAGKYGVRFKYKDEIVFSTEGYTSKASAKNAIESIKKNSPSAVTEDNA